MTPTLTGGSTNRRDGFASREEWMMTTALKSEFDGLREIIPLAMQAAKDKPGRYGGRYVGRRYDRDARQTTWHVLDDDDPDVYRDDESIDIIAQVMPKKVHAIGRARNWLREDGSFSFDD